MKKSLCIIILIIGIIIPDFLIAEEWIEWNEYSDNPIIVGEWDGDKNNEAYYPSVLYDANLFSGRGDLAPYKMWVDKRLQYYISDNGIDWVFITYTDEGLIGTVRHPVVEYYKDGFVGINSEINPSDETMYYRLWYWNADYVYNIKAIYYAESPDGIVWYNCQPITQEAPFIIDNNSVSNWNYGSYGPADVLYNPNATDSGTDWTFTMYYDGSSGSDESIGIGFSANGIHWVGYDSNGDGKADPVLIGSNDVGTWDGRSEDDVLKGYVSRCTVINKNGKYHMWYSGGQGSMNEGIGYASSTDGLTWEKSLENPIFYKSDGVTWRSDRTYCPSVLFDPEGFSGNGEPHAYKMWFAGESDSSAKIGYATAGNRVMKCFGINKSKVIRSRESNADKVAVLNASFQTKLPFADDPVVFSLNGVALIETVFGHFVPSNGNSYIYRSAKGEYPVVSMSLDFNNYKWKAAIHRLDLSVMEMSITFRLQIGEVIGTETINMRPVADDLEYKAEEKIKCSDAQD